MSGSGKGSGTPRRPAGWVLVGILSTMVMDLGSTLLRFSGLTAGLPPRLTGRWFALLARGRPVATTIDAEPAVPGEIAVSATMHYLIGITLTLLFCALVAKTPLRRRPRGASAMALCFGLLTNLLPWLWMFPAMGFGVCGTSAPGEWMLMRSSFASHVLFGCGIALFTRWFGLVPWE